MTLPVSAIGAVALHTLGWSLLHFVWQAALLALALGGALAVTRNSTPRTRYALCCAALALMALCPILTFAYLAYGAGEAPATAPVIAAGPVSSPQLSQDASASPLEHAAAMVDRAMPWILAFWIAGVLLFLARAIAAGLAARKLRTAAIADAPESLLDLAERVGERLGIRRAFEVFVSGAISVPTMVGWLKPVILFPVASLAGMAPEQLEAVLAHELAHIRRWDYLVNALQIAAETLLFYHPAVWWVSRRIRREREHCCDDVAVSVTGSPLVYAKALYLLEEQRAMAPELALGANGGQLSMRIRRLMTGKRSDEGSNGGGLWLVMAALLLLAAGLAVSNATIGKARAQNPAPASAQSPASPSEQKTIAAAHEIPWGEAVKHLTEHAMPEYPEMAKAAHVSGTVRISLTISPQGEVTAAHVVSGPVMLQQAALDAATHLKFSPFTEGGGQPVSTVQTIIFTLPDSDAGKDEVKPDLSCTYYDQRTVAHPGTCEASQSDASRYLCRRSDGDKQAEPQIGCQGKVEALRQWESRHRNP